MIIYYVLLLLMTDTAGLWAWSDCFMERGSERCSACLHFTPGLWSYCIFFFFCHL